MDDEVRKVAAEMRAAVSGGEVTLSDAEYWAARLESAGGGDALAWLDANTTFFDVDHSQPTDEPNVPVLASVSKRIWYHATDDVTSYPFSALIPTTQPAQPALSAEACHWMQQEADYDVYSTGCGHEFVVNDGPPEWPFCNYCARKLVVACSKCDSPHDTEEAIADCAALRRVGGV